MRVLFSYIISEYFWLVQIGLLMGGMVIFHWTSRRIHRFLSSKLDRCKHVWLISFLDAVHVPWLTFFWLLIISFVIPIIILRFEIDLSRLLVVNTIRQLLFLGVCYWSLLNFVTKVEQEIVPRASRLFVRDQTTLRAIAQLSRVALTLILVLMILPMLGFRTSSLLALGGATGLALGFAAKDTFTNVLAGIMIFWDRPFSVGDWIRSPDRNIEGIVEHIGWRLTRVRTFSKRPLYVPNSIFSTVSIENPSRMTNRQINVTIGVRYQDAPVIEPIVKDIDQMIRKHSAIDTTQKIMVYFVEFAASSLNINIWAFTKTTDWGKYREAQQDIFLKAIAIIATHGAECAFPSTTLYVADPTLRSQLDSIDASSKNTAP